MGMQPQLWSVNALSVEFGVDRRTIAKRLAHLTPAGEKNGSPVYRLIDASRAIEPSPIPERGAREPRTLQETIEEITKTHTRGIFALGAPVVRLLISKGMSPTKAVDLTLELWQTFSDQARQMLNRGTLLRGLPMDLARPEAREEFLAKLKNESCQAETKGTEP
jgi:hypothetical protein